MSADDGPGRTRLDWKEWDFSRIPAGELKACFLYEYARESQTIVAIAREMEGYRYSDYSDFQFEPSLWKLKSHNYECGVLLANVGPDLDLAGMPWQALNKTKRAPWQLAEKETKRAFLAKQVPTRRAFEWVPFVDAQLWADLVKNRPDYVKRSAFEIVSFRIDWSKPLREIQKRACALLERHPRSKRLPKGKRGRHAKEEAKYKDALRRLSALRLLARYPLKQAIEIAKARGVELYSDYVGHRTAWENGIKGVVKLMQTTFTLSKTEMPLSWQLLQKRRSQK